jgi:hypothetical protein
MASQSPTAMASTENLATSRLAGKDCAGLGLSCLPEPSLGPDGLNNLACATVEEPGSPYPIRHDEPRPRGRSLWRMLAGEALPRNSLGNGWFSPLALPNQIEWRKVRKVNAIVPLERPPTGAAFPCPSLIMGRLTLHLDDLGQHGVGWAI